MAAHACQAGRHRHPISRVSSARPKGEGFRPGSVRGFFFSKTTAMTSSAIETKLLTDRAGPSMRVRVDPGQTGFFAGRFFRAYIEAIVLKAGPTLQARLSSPVDFILWSQLLTLTQGAIRCEVFTGATPSGSWTSVPVIGVNRMAERPTIAGVPYAPLVTIEKGGDFSGGTAVDLLMVRAAGTNGQASNVGISQSERGLPAGTYYIRFGTLAGGLVVNDDAQLLYAIEWEERVPNLNGPQ